MDSADAPPPPPLPTNVILPIKRKGVDPLPGNVILPIGRKGVGKKGHAINLHTNHFKVSMSDTDDYFYQYNVVLEYEHGGPVKGKSIRKKAIELLQTYNTELVQMNFAYDGGKYLLTVHPLPNNVNKYTVDLDKNHGVNVELYFTAKFPLHDIAVAINSKGNKNLQEYLQTLTIILRQDTAKQQSCFQNDATNFTNLGGDVTTFRQLHSSFRLTQGGLFLNIDVSRVLLIMPGPVLGFLISNQSCENNTINWDKAKRTLKNLRITVHPSNEVYNIVGLSNQPCNQQLSQALPSINIGKKNNPIYVPIELCELVPFQRYREGLTDDQKICFLKNCKDKVKERKKMLTKAHDYPSLNSYGVKINDNFTNHKGRVLEAPKLEVGNMDVICPKDGRWDFNEKKLNSPKMVKDWAIANFSDQFDANDLATHLIKYGSMKGIDIDRTYNVFQENPDLMSAPAKERVEGMFEQIIPNAEFVCLPTFILCILPKKKSDIYGPWKCKCLSKVGVFTQCLAPMIINDRNLTSVLLKINAKLGGINSSLQVKELPFLPLISTNATLIIGIDVCHGSPGQSDPSIAAVVSSREWPSISLYRAFVRTQTRNVEIIGDLFKKVPDKNNNSIICEVLDDFYHSSGQRNPDNIIIFRDGVSESQFHEVLNIELKQIKEACQFYMDEWSPKITLLIAQKHHRQRFFHKSGNVLPGTVIDTQVCHPKNYDFYMCSHFGITGLSRPTHYHVLYDDMGFAPDDLQEIIHGLSYNFQRSTTAISVAAPLRYAHLAAAQMRNLITFDEKGVPGLLPLHQNVESSMFFC